MHKNKHFTLLLFIFLTVIIGKSHGQIDFRLHDEFFQKAKEDYTQWLSSTPMGKFLKVGKLDVYEDKIILTVNDKFLGDSMSRCDSLSGAWEALRSAYYTDNNQQLLHSAMLEKLAFQMDMEIDSTEIIIECPSSDYKLRIYGERDPDGYLTTRFKEKKTTNLATGILSFELDDMHDIFKTGKKTYTNKDAIDIYKVRRAISDFFYERYKTKGTWLWDAKIDTLNSHFNEFTYKITHIDGEVLKDMNYFEYHYINIKVNQTDEKFNIIWKFQAKYGGGLLYPPRQSSSDYHDIESSPYKELFEEYKDEMFKYLEDKLRKYNEK